MRSQDEKPATPGVLRHRFTADLRGAKYRNFQRRLALYSITDDDFIDMLEDQKDACAICSYKFESRNEVRVDHDHDTDEVRGLLCQGCNVGLGMFRDSPQLLAEAISYLAGF